HTLLPVENEYFVQRGYIGAEEDYRALRRRAAQEVQTPPYAPAERVVPAVKEAGALVVTAPPTNYFRRDDTARMDALRRECRLDGVECAHRGVPPELTSFYREYCVRRGLLSTGGSDCHHPEDVLSLPSAPGHTTERHFAAHIGADE